MDKTKLNSVERDLVDGLGEFLTDLKGSSDLAEKYTCRQVTLDLEPHSYTAEDVKATRSLLRVSQSLFARFLGVSPKTVSAWERGSVPANIASRFMDEIQRNPEYYRQRLQESTTLRKTAG